MTIDNDLVVEGNWKKLWQLLVPPKVKHFVWRAARDCLPTKVKLIYRRIQVGSECIVCGVGFDNSCHTFVACPFAEECWSRFQFTDMVQLGIDHSDSFIELIQYILGLSDGEKKACMIMIIWQLWKDRNNAVWNRALPTAHISVTSAISSRMEWMSMQPINRRRREIRGANVVKCRGWHDMQVGWVKCNVDAAFFANINAMGIGIILRNEKDAFIAAKVVCLVGCVRVEEGETMAVQEVISWIKQRNLINVEVETDCKMVSEAISIATEDESEFGLIIANCRELIHSIGSIRVNHVRREANELAHNLARISKDYPYAYVWDEPPSSVEGILHISCMCF